MSITPSDGGDFLTGLSSITGIKVPPAQKPSKSSYDALFEDSGQRHGVDPNLLRAMTNQESTFDPNAVSPKGAQGLMQLIPATARRFGVTNVYDPAQNIEGGAKYMRFLLDRFKGDVPKALAGYNAGEGAVDKYKGIPPYKETQNYVKQILGRYQGTGRVAPQQDNSFLDGLNKIAGSPHNEAPADFLTGLQAITGQSQAAPQEPTSQTPPMMFDTGLPQDVAPVKNLQQHQGVPQIAPAASTVVPPVKPIVAKGVIQKPQRVPRFGQNVTIGDDTQFTDENGNPTAGPVDAQGNIVQVPTRPQVSVDSRDYDQVKNVVAEDINIPSNIKTQAEAAKYVNGQLQAKYPGIRTDFLQFLNGWKPGHGAEVTYGDLVSGGVDINPLIHQKVLEANNEAPDLRVGRNFAEDTANDIKNAFKDLPLGDTLSSAVGQGLASGGRTAQSIAGLLQIIQELNPAKGDSMAEAAGLKPYRAGEDVVKYLQDAANNLGQIGQKTDKGGVQGFVGSAIGGLADLPRIALYPGGPIVAFATDSALQAAGQGARPDWSKVGIEAGKGAALGTIGEVVKPLGLAISNAVGEGTLGKVLSKGTELGTVFGSTIGVSKAFGDSNEDAFKNALLFTVFHAYGSLKEGQPVRVTDDRGNEAVVKVDKEGKVTTLDPKTEAEAQIHIPESTYEQGAKEVDPEAQQQLQNISGQQPKSAPVKFQDGSQAQVDENGILRDVEPQTNAQKDPFIQATQNELDNIPVDSNFGQRGGVFEPPVETETPFQKKSRSEKEADIKASSEVTSESIDQPYYHATTKQAARSIKARGFQAMLGERSNWGPDGLTKGKGVWLYPSEGKDAGLSGAQAFVDNFLVKEGKSGTVLKTNVDGKVFQLADNQDVQKLAGNPDFISELRSKGYVGMTGNELGQAQTFIFEPKAIRIAADAVEPTGQASEEVAKRTPQEVQDVNDALFAKKAVDRQKKAIAKKAVETPSKESQVEPTATLAVPKGDQYTDGTRTGVLEKMPNGTTRVRLREQVGDNPFDGTTTLTDRWRPVQESGASAETSTLPTKKTEAEPPAQSLSQSSKPATPRSYGSKNEGITRERAKTATATIKNALKSERGSFSFEKSDKEVQKAMVDLAAFHYEALQHEIDAVKHKGDQFIRTHVQPFRSFAQRMIEDTSESIKPYLKQLYKQGKAVVDNTKQYGQDFIDMWHGTPHRFNAEVKIRDAKGNERYLVGEGLKMPRINPGETVLEEYPLGRFRGDKFLSGEGAAAYGVGKGGYHADRKGVAKDYQNNLSGNSLAVRYKGQKIDLESVAYNDLPAPVQQVIYKMAERGQDFDQATSNIRDDINTQISLNKSDMERAKKNAEFFANDTNKFELTDRHNGDLHDGVSKQQYLDSVKTLTPVLKEITPSIRNRYNIEPDENLVNLLKKGDSRLLEAIDSLPIQKDGGKTFVAKSHLYLWTRPQFAVKEGFATDYFPTREDAEAHIQKRQNAIQENYDRQLDYLQGENESLQQDRATLNALKPEDFETEGGSTLYRTRIKAKDDELLHWDKPLSQQPEKIQKFINADEELDIPEDATGSEIYREMTRQLGSAEDASAYLNDEGIKGIKFADGSSRNLQEYEAKYKGSPIQNESMRGAVIRAQSHIEANQGDIEKGLQDARAATQRVIDSERTDYVDRTYPPMLDALNRLKPEDFEVKINKKTHNFVAFNPEDVEVRHAWGADNKLIRPEAMQKAAQIVSQKLQEMGRTAHAGIPLDPEMLKALAKVVTFHVEAGARKFGEVAKRMADQYGDYYKTIEPYLRKIYDDVKKTYDFVGMDEPVKKEVKTEVTKAPVVEPKQLTGKTIKYTDEKGNTTEIERGELGARPTKPSRIGKSIEQKSIEQKLTEGFDNTARYDTKTVKEQSARVAGLIASEPDRMMNIIRGGEELPKEIDPSMFIKGVEEYSKTLKGDAKNDLQYELANSDVIKKTSEAAQTMRFAQEREQDEFSRAIKEVKQAREAYLKSVLKGRDIDTAIKEEAQKLARTIKQGKRTLATKQSWSDFVESIVC